MKNLNILSIFLIFSILFSSCVTSDKVISDNFVQKRKYNKGYFVNSTSKINKVEKTSKSEIYTAEASKLNQPKKSLELNQNSYNNNNIFEQPLSASTNLNQDATTKPAKSTYEIISINNETESQSSINNYTIKNNEINKKDARKTHWGAIAGLTTGIVGLFIFGIILGICAIIFSSIALAAIKNHPDVYKGRGMARAGLIIGIVGLVLTIMILSSL